MERIPKNMRYKIACACLALASLFKFSAKIMLPGVICDALTVPDWFIFDEIIMKQVTKSNSHPIDFTWKYQEMPDEYCKDMEKLRRRTK